MTIRPGSPRPTRDVLAPIAAIMMLFSCGPRPSAPVPSTPLSGPGPSAAHTGFDRTLELQGVRFTVSCPNDSSLNALTIQPAGLEIDNSPITRDVDGTVVGAWVADLDRNGSPEVYVHVTSAGSGSYGTLVAYAANNRRSLSEIFLPPLIGTAAVADGYMGHDTFAVEGHSLVRRFPIYNEGDSNARPTGGTRELHYGLVAGEAGWILRLERSITR